MDLTCYSMCMIVVDCLNVHVNPPTPCNVMLMLSGLSLGQLWPNFGRDWGVQSGDPRMTRYMIHWKIGARPILFLYGNYNQVSYAFWPQISVVCIIHFWRRQVLLRDCLGAVMASSIVGTHAKWFLGGCIILILVGKAWPVVCFYRRVGCTAALEKEVVETRTWRHVSWKWKHALLGMFKIKKHINI